MRRPVQWHLAWCVPRYWHLASLSWIWMWCSHVGRNRQHDPGVRPNLGQMWVFSREQATWPTHLPAFFTGHVRRPVSAGHLPQCSDHHQCSGKWPFPSRCSCLGGGEMSHFTFLVCRAEENFQSLRISEGYKNPSSSCVVSASRCAPGLFLMPCLLPAHWGPSWEPKPDAWMEGEGGSQGPQPWVVKHLALATHQRHLLSVPGWFTWCFPAVAAEVQVKAWLVCPEETVGGTDALLWFDSLVNLQNHLERDAIRKWWSKNKKVGKNA